VLDFLSPRGAQSPLTAELASHGPAPYAATLASASTKGALDPGKTCAARLTLV
jgi:hypothetical protein